MRMVGLMHDESKFKPTSRSTIRAKVNKTEPKKACSATSSPYIDHLRLNLPQDLRSVPFQIPDFRLNLHQARRRRPGRAPHRCSRTPPRFAAPPQDEISLRNNLFRRLYRILRETRRAARRGGFGNRGPPRGVMRSDAMNCGPPRVYLGSLRRGEKQKRTRFRLLPITRLSRSTLP